jgi:DNA gyrase subunit A
MPLPEDEENWGQLDVVFATSHGTVRRNSLEDFRNIRANGLIAMKLESDEKLISVRTCTDRDDIVLSTRKGKAIRFSLDELRVFKSRASTGIRGIKIGAGDEVVSIAVIRHVDVTADERLAFLKKAAQTRNQTEEDAGETDEEATGNIVLTQERFDELAKQEDFLLAVTSKGFGKRTSAYEYRTTGRGGSGIWNMKLGARNGEIVGSFSVVTGDEVMLVTNGGQIIRMPVDDVRFVGRQTQGVTLFRVDGAEEVVSVAVIRDDGTEA